MCLNDQRCHRSTHGLAPILIRQLWSRITTEIGSNHRASLVNKPKATDKVMTARWLSLQNKLNLSMGTGFAYQNLAIHHHSRQRVIGDYQLPPSLWLARLIIAHMFHHIVDATLGMIDGRAFWAVYLASKHTHTQLFNGLLSGTTQVGRYQKKHSPTHTQPDHWTFFIIFLHLQQSMASSLFILRAWQSSRTTSLQVLFGLPLG